MAADSGYSSAQILSMQKDAVRRVNEMQRIAQERLRQTAAAMNGGGPPSERSGRSDRPERPIPPPPKPSPPAPPSAPQPHAAAVPAESEVLPGPMQGILDRMGLDQESVLLLVLLLTLINEGADNSLILALVYILL